MNSHSRHSGFTLIELVIVLVVIAIMLGIAAPSLRGWGRGAELNDAARGVLTATQWARTEALATATVHRVEIDPAGTGYRVLKQDAATYSPVGEFGTAKALPNAMTVRLASGGIAGTSIDFYPNGRCTPATIRVTSGSGGGSAEISAGFPADTFHLVIDGRQQ